MAAEDWLVDDLLDLLRCAYPYWNLSTGDFEAILGMLAGEHPFEMDRPPRPLILWDRVSGRLSAARGSASITAMCVGTIPETSEYEVVIEGTRKHVGRLQSDFVDDRLRIGDVFVLGSSAWKLIGARRNRLFVQPAPGEIPTVPRWSGRAEARTAEVGGAVGALRGEIASRLDDPKVAAWLATDYRLCPHSADALVEYIREQKLAAGFVPDHQRMLVEVWRDKVGDTNLILHSPYGDRINRAWGLVLADAAASTFGYPWSITSTNDVVVLTSDGGPEAHFSAADAQALFESTDPDAVAPTVRRVAREEGVLSSAFRDVAVCALQVFRTWQGKRVPFWLQSYRAGELFEAAHPHADYPVITEVLRTYLEESLDVPGLTDLLDTIASGAISVVNQDVETPSPFCHAVISRHLLRRDDRMGRDHRARLLRLHRELLEQVLSDEQMADLLDSRAIEHLERRRLHRAAGARARSSEELLQAIRNLGDPPATTEALTQMVDGDPAALLGPLVAERRVVALELPESAESPIRLVTADLWREYCDAYSLVPRGGRGTVLIPKIEAGEITGFDRTTGSQTIPVRWRRRLDAELARRSVLERFLRCRGPVSVHEVISHTGWPMDRVEHMLNALVDSGSVARGTYTRAKLGPQWVNRANLEEIHRRTLGYLKRELAPCEPAEVVDFMVRWQHLHPACRLSGIDGLRAVVRQLQGYEVLSGVLEPDLLRFRVADYGPHLLEQLIASGEVQWLRVGDGVSRGKLTLCLAEDAAWLGRGVESSFDVEAEADADIAGVIQRVRNHFRSRPVGFFDDLVPAAGADEGATLRAVWYLAWCGELTCGTYECLRHASFRSLLSACYDTASTPADIVGGRLSPERVVDRLRERRMDPRLAPWMATDRLLGSAAPLDRTEIVRRWARQLLDRWGVVTRDMVSSEEAAPPWTELEPELKRLELTGVVTRGYFIESHYGVQYGLPDALDLLRDCRSGGAGGSGSPSPREAPFVGLSPRDPANLYVSCLEVMQENGVRLQTPRRRSADRPTVVRSGRPVLHAGHQVETLTRGQLRDCVDALRWTPSGEEARTTFRTWNGRPIDTSPVSDVLWEMGFRFDRPGQMAWPPQRETGDPPRVPRQEILLPHYLEPSPVADEPNPKVAPAPDSDSPVREAVGPNAIAINRTPVLTLWGTVVSQRLGYDWETALTLGRCLSGLNAQTKGRRLGIFAAPKGTDDDSAPRKMGLGEEFWIRICGRSLPARRTVRGVRAVTGDRAIAPRSVENYLKGRFGDRFEDARTRMTELAGSYTPELLDQAAWDLYVRFRPRIPDGIEGWGAQGVLDLDLIRSLARG